MKVKPEAPPESKLGRSSGAGNLEGRETPEGTLARQLTDAPQSNSTSMPTIVINEEKDDSSGAQGSRAARRGDEDEEYADTNRYN